MRNLRDGARGGCPQSSAGPGRGLDVTSRVVTTMVLMQNVDPVPSPEENETDGFDDPGRETPKTKDG